MDLLLIFTLVLSAVNMLLFYGFLKRGERIRTLDLIAKIESRSRRALLEEVRRLQQQERQYVEEKKQQTDWPNTIG